MGVVKNVGTAGMLPQFADSVTPANKPAGERTWVDRMYLGRDAEMVSDGTRGGDFNLLEQMLRNNS